MQPRVELGHRAFRLIEPQSAFMLVRTVATKTTASQQRLDIVQKRRRLFSHGCADRMHYRNRDYYEYRK